MDVVTVLIELREELHVLNAAIASLERLQHVEPPKKGPDTRKLDRPSVRRDAARVVTKTRKTE